VVVRVYGNRWPIIAGRRVTRRIGAAVHCPTRANSGKITIFRSAEERQKLITLSAAFKRITGIKKTKKKNAENETTFVFFRPETTRGAGRVYSTAARVYLYR